jgi:hypothetical protein
MRIRTTLEKDTVGYLIDDFDGERPDSETLSTEALHDIRRQTVQAMDDPRDLTPKQMWTEQLDIIDEELASRR